MTTFYFPDTADLPLPYSHRFPAEKYRLLREYVTREGVLGSARLRPSPPVTRQELRCAHDDDYIDAVFTGDLGDKELRRIGLPWSTTLRDRTLAAVGGTLAAARNALRDGVSGQLAGGTHHAHAGFGSGYCVFNDVAVAALTLLNEQLIGRCAVLDLDVHQGDGTAALLSQVPAILTVSIHGEKNFPFRKVASDIDIGLADGTDGDTYLGHVEVALGQVTQFAPDLVFYIAGADPLATDKLGRLALSHDDLIRRDLSVLSFCRKSHTPVVVVLGGGYADPISDTVTAYANTLRAVRQVFDC